MVSCELWLVPSGSGRPASRQPASERWKWCSDPSHQQTLQIGGGTQLPGNPLSPFIYSSIHHSAPFSSIHSSQCQRVRGGEHYSLSWIVTPPSEHVHIFAVPSLVGVEPAALLKGFHRGNEPSDCVLGDIVSMSALFIFHLAHTW